MEMTAKAQTPNRNTSTFRLLGFGAALALASALPAVNAAESATDKAKDAPAAPAAAAPVATPAPAEKAKALPKLVDLGAIGCKPCKIMDGELATLRAAYPGKLDVEFINVRTDKEKAQAYKIRVIPTQIWIDAAGKELFRHEGVMSAKDITAKFKELGIDLGAPAAPLETPEKKDEAGAAAGSCCG